MIDEIRRKTATKTYLASRITQTEVGQLAHDLLVLSESIPELDEPFSEIGRDRKDDYLFAHAVLGQADYLVSGDMGVRSVNRIGDLCIVSPAEFLQVLRHSGRLPDEPS